MNRTPNDWLSVSWEFQSTLQCTLGHVILNDVIQYYFFNQKKTQSFTLWNCIFFYSKTTEEKCRREKRSKLNINKQNCLIHHQIENNNRKRKQIWNQISCSALFGYHWSWFEVNKIKTSNVILKSANINRREEKRQNK